MSDAYLAGKEAYRKGIVDSDNPFPMGSDEATDWFDGWYDEEFFSD